MAVLPYVGDDYALADWQGTYDGYLFGPTVEPAVLWSEAAGLHGYTVKVNDAENDRGDGSIRSPGWRGSRQISMAFELVGADVEAQRHALRSVFAPDPYDLHVLRWKLPGLAACRTEAYVTEVPWTVSHQQQFMTVDTVILQRPDANVYSDVVEDVPLPLFLSATVAGENIPVVNIPLNMAAPTTSTAIAPNLGNEWAYPMLYFRVLSGTASSFSVTNMDLVETTTITTSMAAGQILTFDAAAAAGRKPGRPVDLSGANRYSAWNGVDLRLRGGRDGVTTQLSLSQTGATTVDAWITYRHTYHS